MSTAPAGAGSDLARQRALRYLNLFRLVIAGFFLVAGSKAGLGHEGPGLFWGAAAAYVSVVLLLGFPDAAQRIGFNRLMMIQGIVDVALLSAVMWASGGFRSGIPVMMMIVLAGSGLVAEGRSVLFMAALATLALLGENAWRDFAGKGEAAGDFFQVGVTCASFFGIAIVARLLAHRARINASLAAARGEALAQQEAINAHIIRDMRDGIIVLDADGVVRQANPSAYTLLGQASIEGRPIMAVDQTLAEFCRAGADEVGQLMQLGQARRLLRCRVVAGAGGAERGMLIYLTDLEDIQRRMQQLKLVSLGRLTASMAHEIRNPLSAVTQAAELLCEEKRSETQARLARIINSNALRIEHMIRDVLALGRRDAAQPEALPLAGFVVDLFDELSSLRGENERAIFAADIDPALTLGIDRTHLHQILDNLLVNARRYCSGKPGAVKVSAGDVGEGWVQLHIKDDGPGIDEQARAHLFEPFFTSHAKGTGLGLYIARELAETNGITLELMDDDPQDPGAHFVLTGRNKPS
ncbi:MAG: PAS domain-containing sensor histidine kinase [Azoarcus sp.]|jgi:two-component system sensor histidine kinase PilS (NtrC family)|nr:PAS domain-containing sensor histidine kinase [Azoarcus sp.]